LSRMRKIQEMRRCDWSTFSNNPLMVQYHDEEWGLPVHNDRTLFEFLSLEGAQAGLSWQTILNKRGNYVKAFDRFDPRKIATYDKDRVRRLINDPGIVRNRLKILATVANAQRFLTIQQDFGSFDRYVWRFVNGKPIVHKIKSMHDIPVTTTESDALSKDLRDRGFKFVGSTICYSFMQAVGMANDHAVYCFRYKDLV